MPKINITEVDNTTPGSRAYSNFTVVVPGFHAKYFTTEDAGLTTNHDANGNLKGIILEKPGATEGTWEAQTDADVFGDNGIKEITSVSDFETYIGYVKPNATLKDNNFKATMTGTVAVVDGAVTISFTTLAGVIVKDVVIKEKNATAFKTSFSDAKLTAVEEDATTHAITSITYDDTEYTCTRASTEESTPEEEAQKTDAEKAAGIYEFVAAEASAIDVPAHYGNQIAYELLNMGYTIYYVNMGEWNAADAQNMAKAIKALGDDDFWAPLRDKTTYDFRFILTGLIEGGDADTRAVISYMNNANRAISTLADYESYTDNDVFNHVRKRGDCLALIDLDEAAIERAATAGLRSGAAIGTKKIVNAIKQEIKTLPASVNKYSAVFTSSVIYSNNSNAGSDGYNNSRFPGSFHYLACFDNMLANNYAEWFAAAGFTRGTATYNVAATKFDLGDLAVQALEPRYKDDKDPNSIPLACNVIVRNLNNYYIWGNRTAHALQTELVASHFLNIRQLCITIKKFVYNLCRNFTFDPNSEMLWRNFVNRLKPLLETMKVGQGIKDYSIDKRPTDLKGVMSARIRIVPIEAVEDFDIELALEDSLNGGTTATITE